MWSTDAAARLRGFAPLVLLAAALGGCGSLATGYDEKAPLTPLAQHTITVEETPDRLAMTPHPEGLSPAQRVALIGFVSRWRAAVAAGDIAVQVPAGGDQAAIAKTASDVTGALQALGVPSQAVRLSDYTAPAGAERVLASFSSLEARGPDCSRGWNNLTSTGANEVSEHFGCAVTANLAAQIADPRDLISPTASTASDAARREVVLGKYRRGETTSTSRDDQAVGTISGAVGSK
jgi:pilus assembly protein CpaD